MKVNRYGMSQPIFIKMVKAWCGVQLQAAGQMLVFGHALPDSGAEFKRCGEVLTELRDVVTRTFLAQDEDVVEFIRCIQTMEERLVLEVRARDERENAHTHDD